MADAIVERLMARIRQEHLASASPQQTSAVNQPRPESAGVPATRSASEGEAAGSISFRVVFVLWDMWWLQAEGAYSLVWYRPA